MARNGELVTDAVGFRNRKGLVHVKAGKTRLVFERTVFLAALEEAQKITLEWALDGVGDNVIPLCELCRRHDLPRHIE